MTQHTMPWSVTRERLAGHLPPGLPPNGFSPALTLTHQSLPVQVSFPLSPTRVPDLWLTIERDNLPNLDFTVSIKTLPLLGLSQQSQHASLLHLGPAQDTLSPL